VRNIETQRKGDPGMAGENLAEPVVGN
jgi:hypothetical protein